MEAIIDILGGVFSAHSDSSLRTEGPIHVITLLNSASEVGP